VKKVPVGKGMGLSIAQNHEKNIERSKKSKTLKSKIF
jgi:hypothetical protein